MLEGPGTAEFLQYQIRRVHVVAVTKVSCVFVGIYEEEVCFQETTRVALEYLKHVLSIFVAASSSLNVSLKRDVLTSDNLADTTVWINTADLFGMCRVHLHLPAKEESWNKNTHRDVTTGYSMKC